VRGTESGKLYRNNSAPTPPRQRQRRTAAQRRSSAPAVKGARAAPRRARSTAFPHARARQTGIFRLRQLAPSSLPRRTHALARAAAAARCARACTHRARLAHCAAARRARDATIGRGGGERAL
jgi:hypothetical protein